MGPDAIEDRGTLKVSRQIAMPVGAQCGSNGRRWIRENPVEKTTEAVLSGERAQTCGIGRRVDVRRDFVGARGAPRAQDQRQPRGVNQDGASRELRPRGSGGTWPRYLDESAGQIDVDHGGGTLTGIIEADAAFLKLAGFVLDTT